MIVSQRIPTGKIPVQTHISSTLHHCGIAMSSLPHGSQNHSISFSTTEKGNRRGTGEEDLPRPFCFCPGGLITFPAVCIHHHTAVCIHDHHSCYVCIHDNHPCCLYSWSPPCCLYSWSLLSVLMTTIPAVCIHDHHTFYVCTFLISSHFLLANLSLSQPHAITCNTFNFLVQTTMWVLNLDWMIDNFPPCIFS